MRILSQTGMVDLPYELVGLSLSYKIVGTTKDTSKFCINAHSDALGAKRVIMGEYSSDEKAKKVMERLRNVYYESELSKINNDRTSFLTTHFQFPADDEIEVWQ